MNNLTEVLFEAFKVERMIEFDELLLFGASGELNSKLSLERINALFGEPDIYTPEFKSYPTMVVFGSLEFRLRNNNLETVVFSLNEEDLEVPKVIDIDSVKSRTKRSFTRIEKLLFRNDVNWSKDEIMSDDDLDVFISENNVHFAFYEGILVRVGIVHEIIS